MNCRASSTVFIASTRRARGRQAARDSDFPSGAGSRRRMEDRFGLKAVRARARSLRWCCRLHKNKGFTKRQDLCTTEALRHGEKQKINGFYLNRRFLVVSKIRVWIFRLSLSSRKIEDTEVLNLPQESGQ